MRTGVLSEATGVSSFPAFLSRLAAGEEEAWRQCYQRYAGYIERLIGESVARRNWFPLRGHEEDLLVETFERLYRGAGQLRRRDEPGFKAFVRTLALHVCLDALRRIGPVGEDPPDDLPDPDRFAEVIECEQIFRQAVSRLDAGLRTIVTDTLYGYSPEEIARRRRLRPQQVYDRKYRALRRLGAALNAAQFMEQCANYVSRIRFYSPRSPEVER